MLEPDSGDRGWRKAVSSWDIRGKFMLRFGRPSLAGIFDIAWAFSAPDLSDLIGDKKPSCLILGMGSGSLLTLLTYFGAVGIFINSVISDGLDGLVTFDPSSLSWLEVSGVANLATGILVFG